MTQVPDLVWNIDVGDGLFESGPGSVHYKKIYMNCEDEAEKPTKECAIHKVFPIRGFGYAALAG